MSLSPELEQRYIPIIDGILSTADLQQISAKKIRQGLQGALDYDISSQKEAINALIMTRFDKISERRNAAAKAQTPKPATNGYSTMNGASPHTTVSGQATPAKRESSAVDDMSDVAFSSPPKKAKRPIKNDDALLAARLQAEENSRARPTRGGNVNRRNVMPKKKRKQKSAVRVKGSDDSDLGSGSEEGKEVKRNGAFHKPMTLSPALSELLDGETTLSRPQTVKKIWDHVKRNGLQNPNDKRQIICDEKMRTVFKADSVHMFTMNKLLSNHIWPQDE